MSNADLPSQPQPVASTIDGYSFSTYEHGQEFSGLTKREHFASMMLQGIISNPDFKFHDVRLAVEIADELLEELEK